MKRPLHVWILLAFALSLSSEGSAHGVSSRYKTTWLRGHEICQRDLIASNSRTVITLTRHPVTPELSELISERVNEVEKNTRYLNDEVLLNRLKHIESEFFDRTRRKSPTWMNYWNPVLPQMLVAYRLRDKNLYAGLNAPDGLARLQAFREAFGLEEKLKYEYRANRQFRTLDEMLLATDAELESELTVIEDKIRRNRELLVIELADGQVMPASPYQRARVLSEALEPHLPGKSQVLYQGQGAYGRHYRIERNVDGENAAWLNYTLSTRRHLASLGIEVAFKYRNLGLNYFMTAEMLTLLPDLEEADLLLGYENYLSFRRALPPKVREYIENHAELESSKMPREYVAAVTAAMSQTPALKVVLWAGWEVTSYRLEMALGRGERFYIRLKPRNR